MITLYFVTYDGIDKCAFYTENEAYWAMILLSKKAERCNVLDFTAYNIRSETVQSVKKYDYLLYQGRNYANK